MRVVHIALGTRRCAGDPHGLLVKIGYAPEYCTSGDRYTVDLLRQPASMYRRRG